MPKPEEAKKSDDVGNKEESWFRKWVDLIKSLLGTNELESIARDLASGATGLEENVVKASQLLANVEDNEKRDFFKLLVDALLEKDNEKVKTLIDTKFPKKDDKRLFDGLIRQTKSRKDGEEIDTETEDNMFEGSRTKVEKKRRKVVEKIAKSLDDAGKKEEGIMIKDLVESMREEAERIRKEREVDPDEDWFKDHLKARRNEVEQALRMNHINEGQADFNVYLLRKAEELLGKWYKEEKLPEKLTNENKAVLHNFLFDGSKEDRLAKEKLILKLIEKAGHGSEAAEYLWGELGRQSEAEKPRSPEERRRRIDELAEEVGGVRGGEKLKKLLHRMTGAVGEDEYEAQGAGLRYLNIIESYYPQVNQELREKLEIDFDALEFDEGIGLWRVSDKLSKDKKDKLTEIIFDRLAAEVRQAVDEGADLRERHYEPLLRVYNTLTAIVGLDTAQKSEIKQKLNFEVLSFMLFNSYTDQKTQEMVAEMATHIGSESNIFMGMLRRRETFRLKNAEGKEIEIGAFNTYDFAKTMATKITDPKDRLTFQITAPVDEVERTYGTMMYASNKPEVKIVGRGVVIRKTIIDTHGLEHYNNLLNEFGGAAAIGADPAKMSEIETTMLEGLAKKYFDYPSGVYVYWRMTNQMADYIGNAHVDNTKLAPPAGMPEALWKNDMKLLYLFHEKYSGVRHVDMLLQLRTAFNSMMVKEGAEVWSWLVNVDENPTTQVESIYTGLFGGKKVDSKDPRIGAATKVQQAILASMFEDETIHLSEHNRKLHKHTEVFEEIPAKRDKNGLLVLDTMTRRRDWGTFTEKMRVEMAGWGDDVYKQMDFSFIVKRVKHIPRLYEAMSKNIGEASEDKKAKFLYLIENMSDELGFFDNLAQKRPDDPMKYNLENFGAASKAVLALAQDISYSNAIAFIQEAQKVSGVGKVRDIAILLLKRVREKREVMGLGQIYTVPMKKDGQIVIDPDSWVGDLRGSYPLFKLEKRYVTPNDIMSHPEGVSIASLAGNPTAVDKEEIEFKYALDRLNEYNILTEEEYKHEVKDFYKEMRGFNSKKPISELWAFLTGKKIWGYWAARLNVPEEVLKKWVFEGGGEFIGLWWKYFNGTGAGHH